MAEVLADNADFANLQTIPNVGPRTATQIVAPVDVSEFRGRDRLASYCGPVPATRQSGKPVNYDKHSQGGNKALKNLLIFSCNSLMRSKGRYGERPGSCIAQKSDLSCPARRDAVFRVGLSAKDIEDHQRLETWSLAFTRSRAPPSSWKTLQTPCLTKL
jgi:hypothetical protein